MYGSSWSLIRIVFDLLDQMGSVSSEDELERLSERFERYSISADVSESESSGGGFLCRPYYDHDCDSEPSPLAGPDFSDNSAFPAQVPVTLPVIGGRHVVITAEDETEKPQRELTG